LLLVSFREERTHGRTSDSERIAEDRRAFLSLPGFLFLNALREGRAATPQAA
jgi:hypothetical protein